jgi:hypothetical protein
MAMLRLGRGRHVVENPRILLETYVPSRVAGGPAYHSFSSSTPTGEVVPEDLAATIALSGRASSKAFASLVEFPLRLNLPRIPLGDADDALVRYTAEVIVELAGLPGFGVSLATKTLHPKRPELVPVMDRGAFSGAYMDPEWRPGREPTTRSWPETMPEVERAMRQARHDLRAPENRAGWMRINSDETTKVCTFDKLWWVFAWPKLRGFAGL